MYAPDIDPPVANPKRPHNALPRHSCDSHAHIFGAQDRYPLSEQRSYTPHETPQARYAALLSGLGFDRAVLVQPSAYGTDNRLLTDALREGRDGRFGIEWRAVAVLDNTVADAQLETLHSLGVRGVRFNLLYPGAGLDLRDAEGLARRVKSLGWHIQLMIDISKTPHWSEFIRRTTNDVVVDHMGHAPARELIDSRCFSEFLDLLDTGRLWVKLTGPNRISTLQHPPFSDVQQVAEKLIERAPGRLVFGTDWPHVVLPGPMPDDGELVDEFFRWIGGDQGLANTILVDSPATLYGF